MTLTRIILSTLIITILHLIHRGYTLAWFTVLVEQAPSVLSTATVKQLETRSWARFETRASRREDVATCPFDSDLPSCFSQNMSTCFWMEWRLFWRKFNSTHYNYVHIRRIMLCTHKPVMCVWNYYHCCIEQYIMSKVHLLPYNHVWS